MRRLLPDADLLARLVAFDSTSCNSNLPIADFLADYLDRPGARIDRNVSAAGDKANLIVHVGPQGADERKDRPGLVLSGHMDVVPAGDGWHSDPFELADRGDRYVGRGACDMKGFLALAANLAAETDPAALSAPLVLVFTYDEEVGTLGARRLFESYARGASLPARAVIGEPTSLAVARLHKGHLKMRVTVRGTSAHSGYPHLGVNAIEPAGRVISTLAALRETLEREEAPHRELFPEVPFVPLNVGTVRGGAAINLVPDRCIVELGLRPLPGMDSSALALRVREAVAAAVASPPFPFAPEVEVLSDSPPMLLAEGSPLHRYLCALNRQESARSVSFATDAGWLQRLGIDCAIWGPGSIAAAHKPDEHVPKAELVAARGLLAQTIRHFCVEEA
ncbi:MAG TPA: acetylornithine deacetylase [Thermoanaerobaculia bacterium]|nr:acetylornithine deacetylase [Thermoanaerobaculia bacterium]